MIREFGALRGEHCAVIDVSSAALVSLPSYTALLTKPMREVGGVAALESRARSDQRFWTALQVLCRMIVYDFLAIDEYAWHIEQLRPISEELIHTVHIPDNVYDQALENVYRLPSDLIGRWGSHYPLQDAMGVEFESTYVHRVAESRSIRRSHYHAIASSNLVVPRALFYFEIGREVGVPTFLNPLKLDFIRSIRQRLNREAFTLVESTVDKKLRGDMSALLNSAFGQDIAFEAPPLISMTLREADRHGKSILETVLQIRETDPARDFRRWLKDIQQSMTQATPAADLQVQRKLAELNPILDHWREDAVPEHAVTKVGKVFNLEMLPAIGPLLKAMNMEKLPLEFTIDPRQNYLAFLANWYREVPDFSPYKKRWF